MATDDRAILFENERFVIGVLQAVSAGSLVGAISQSKTLWPMIGEFWFFLFLTLQFVALGLAVFAAYAKHLYKMWDVKARAQDPSRDDATALRYSAKANFWLPMMRRVITASILMLLGGFAVFVGSAWAHWAAANWCDT